MTLHLRYFEVKLCSICNVSGFGRGYSPLLGLLPLSIVLLEGLQELKLLLLWRTLQFLLILY